MATKFGFSSLREIPWASWAVRAISFSSRFTSSSKSISPASGTKISIASSTWAAAWAGFGPGAETVSPESPASGIR